MDPSKGLMHTIPDLAAAVEGIYQEQEGQHR
jgi:hypothetical protein